MGQFAQCAFRLLAAAAVMVTGCLLALAPLSAAASPTGRAASVPAPQPAAAVGAASNPAAVVNHPRGVVPRWVTGATTSPSTPSTSSSSSRSGFLNPHCAGCAPPLVFHPNTPVMGNQTGQLGHVTITPIYWNPTGSALTFTPTYKSLIQTYLQNVAAASGQNSNVFSVATQYYQQLTGNPVQRIQYAVTAGAQVNDTFAFPAQGVAGTSCAPNTGKGYTLCITDAQLQTELARFLAGPPAMTMNDANLYLVFLPNTVDTCMLATGQPGTQSCASVDFCAYHGGFGSTPGNTVVYANEPFPPVSGCGPVGGDQTPNADAFADNAISLVSHEASEAITDTYNTWYDTAGYENGDECVYTYGRSIGGTAGALYNQVINGAHYYTQLEFSNQDYAANLGDVVSDTDPRTVRGCVQREELPTVAFTVPTPIAGNAATFDGRASADPDNTSPLSYSWTWGDGTPGGTGSTPSHTFANTGPFTVVLTVTDGDLWANSLSQVVTVNAPTVPGPPTGVTASPGSTQVALTWTPPTNNGGRPVSGYTVTPYIGATAQPPIPTGSSASSFTVSPLTSGTAYTFTVAATNSVGTGAPSAPSNSATPLLSNQLTLESLGGILTSGAGTSTWGANRLDVFVRGSDNALYHKSRTGSAWTGFESLGGRLLDDPAAISWGPNRIDVFIRGVDNQLWHMYWSGTAWSGWEPLGGSLSSGPAVTAWNGNRLDIFVRGSDQTLQHKYWLGTAWSTWETLGGVLNSDPGVVSSASNTIDIFIRGSDQQLWHKTWTGTAWIDWTPMGGILSSGPDATSCTAGHHDVLVVGSDHALWRNGWNGSQWSGWQLLGGKWLSDPSAVCQSGATSADMFSEGTDQALWHGSFLAS